MTFLTVLLLGDQAGHGLLERLMSPTQAEGTAVMRACSSPQELQLSRDLLSLYTAPGVRGLEQAAAAPVLSLLATALTVPPPAAAPDLAAGGAVRSAALAALTPDLFAALPPAHQLPVFQVSRHVFLRSQAQLCAVSPSWVMQGIALAVSKGRWRVCRRC